MTGTFRNRWFLVTLCWSACVLGILFACAGNPLAVARSLRAEGEAEEPFEVLVWQAGREIAPGLSAARAAELEAGRARALDLLRGRHSAADSRRLGAWLEQAETPDELWCAASRTAAALEFYDLARGLQSGLEPGASPRRAVSARDALHRLYGRWFTSSESLSPYLTSIEGGKGTRLLLASSAWEEQRSRERLLAELSHDPPAAAAWLSDPDPGVRSGAARVLGQAFARSGADADATLQLLVAHLEDEHEPTAFHEGLNACLPALERAAVDERQCARLRTLLFDLARTEADPRTLSAANALAALAWRKEGARDAGHLLSGIDVLACMLRGLASADRRRGVADPDPLVGVLAALRELCNQAAASGFGEEIGNGSAHDAVFAVLGDAAEDGTVRAAAAAALGPLTRASDSALLVGVLEDPAVGAPVKHALLGSLRTILGQLAPSEPSTRALLGAVADLTGANDSDLRRRALSLCADEHLEPLVSRLDPAFLVQRLDQETSTDATLVLLRLIQRFGRADMLPSLLASSQFDRLAADPALLDAFAPALEALARRSGPEAVGVARRLAAVQAEATNLARLRHALALVAELDPAAISGLQPDEHREIAAWLWRVCRSGVFPREAVPQGVAFEQRVLEVHLPRGENAPGQDPDGFGSFESAHLAALLRADLFLAGAGGVMKPEVEAAFETAHRLAEKPELELLVLRDRARFRAAANECVKALGDYRRLLEAGELADALLGIPDLRSAVELLGRLDEAGSGPSPTAGEAFDLLARVVKRQAWRAEPASVRMQDLRDLVHTGLESGDRERLLEIEAALSDLPLTQVESQSEREPPSLWLGLTREPGWFQELLDLRARVRLALREIDARG